MEANTSSLTLLRSAQAEQTSPEALLRPAEGAQNTAPEELLRGVEAEERTAISHPSSETHPSQ